jgi:hypothetical protein
MVSMSAAAAEDTDCGGGWVCDDMQRERNSPQTGGRGGRRVRKLKKVGKCEVSGAGKGDEGGLRKDHDVN